MKKLSFSCSILSILTTFASLSTFANPNGQDQGRNWDDDNNPRNLSPNYIYEFDKLPYSGELKDKSKGWSDTFWPQSKGTIVYRWQTQTDFKKDKSPNFIQVKSNPDLVRVLSPAEKWDLVKSNLDFPLAKKLRKEFDGKEKYWRGLCDGWVQATLNFNEPKPFTYKHPTMGIEIPFGSSDLKGLLTYYYADVSNEPVRFVGRRCSMKPGMMWSMPSCKDTNAGAFHVIMTNELGLKGEGFMADRDPAKEVWNQPYVGYRFKIDSIKDKKRGEKLSKKASSQTWKEIYVTAELDYVNDETGPFQPIQPQWDPIMGTSQQTVVTTTLKYVLDLNYYGKIIGGDWLEESELFPDFIWARDFVAPEGEWSQLMELYRQSQQ